MVHHLEVDGATPETIVDKFMAEFSRQGEGREFESLHPLVIFDYFAVLALKF